jgi:hypothetical protein
MRFEVFTSGTMKITCHLGCDVEWICSSILEECAVCISWVEESPFYPEGGGSAFLQIITEHLSDFMASCPRENIVMVKRLISRF